MVKIIKYLWDLDIKNLTLAWEDLYRQAQSDFKDGMFTEIETPFEGVKEIFADPVICRKLLIENFEKYSKKANQTMKELEMEFSKENFNELVRLDAILYNILSYWLDDLLDISSMDPKNFIDNIKKSSMDHYLYTLTNPSPWLKTIDNYRLLNI